MLIFVSTLVTTNQRCTFKGEALRRGCRGAHNCTSIGAKKYKGRKSLETYFKGRNTKKFENP